jgi:hypothetical protein
LTTLIGILLRFLWQLLFNAGLHEELQQEFILMDESNI